MNNINQERSGFLMPIVLILLIFAAWGFTWFALYDNADRGTFGDMFGGINALFSGLAFVGVIYAILLQRQELQLQRRELSLTRIEFEGQKEALKAQNKTLEKQNFENTFFQLLRLHNDIVNSIDLVSIRNKAVITKGRDCLKTFYGRFRGTLSETVANEGESEIDRIDRAYMIFYPAAQAEIGHYFRSLYNIVKFVDNSDIPNKRLYTNLVRAQLSSFELALLFYNCLSAVGREKFKPLIEKYALLKTIPYDEFKEEPTHIELYAASAYK